MELFAWKITYQHDSLQALAEDYFEHIEDANRAANSIEHNQGTVVAFQHVVITDRIRKLLRAPS